MTTSCCHLLCPNCRWSPTTVMTAPSCHSLPWPSSAAPLGVARCLPAACLRTGWSCTVCTSCPPSCAYPSSRQGARWWGRSPWPPQMVSESCICNKPGVTPYPNTPRVLPPSQDKVSIPCPHPLEDRPGTTCEPTGRPDACYSLQATCMLQLTCQMHATAYRWWEMQEPDFVAPMLCA